MSTNTENVVNRLYKDVALWYNITVDELKHRTTVGGEKLIHQYYTEKYPHGF